MLLKDLPGLGEVLARRVEYKFGPTAFQKIANNPYKLTEVHGIGFAIADKIARDVFNVTIDSPARIKAGIDYWFEQRELDGHTCATRAELFAACSQLLGVNPGKLDISGLYAEDDLLAPFDMQAKERRIAEMLLRLNTPPHAALRVDTSKLFQDQIEACWGAIRYQVFAITGSPGTGKTATIAAIVASNPQTRILLCAPTGKAAKRLEELTKHRASTIHRALEPQVTGRAPNLQFVFGRNEARPLDASLIIVDECSMVDTWLMYRLLLAVAPSARLILVGDPYQLPSVGPGNVLGDIIQSGAIQYQELTEIKRTAQDLLIARNCARIKRGETPESPAGAADWFFFERNTPEAIAETIVELVTKKLPAKYACDPIRDIQTITALKERSELCTAALNRRLRAVLNPQATSLDKLEAGDRVICTRNDYKLNVFNGDIGTVVDVDGTDIRIAFDVPPRELTCRRSAIGLELAYALTVHKAQGSEWPFVAVPIHRCLGPVVTRRPWLYTSVSRARRATILVGSKVELAAIVARTQDVERRTLLGRFLRAGRPEQSATAEALN